MQVHRSYRLVLEPLLYSTVVPPLPLSAEARLQREEELRSAQLELWDMHFDSGNELRSQGCERLCALLQQITDPMAQGVVRALETALPLLCASVHVGRVLAGKPLGLD